MYYNNVVWSVQTLYSFKVLALSNGPKFWRPTQNSEQHQTTCPSKHPECSLLAIQFRGYWNKKIRKDKQKDKLTSHL